MNTQAKILYDTLIIPINTPNVH